MSRRRTGSSRSSSWGTAIRSTEKTATIYTLVTDIRDNSDEMSVTWIIAGGAHRVIATATGTPTKKFGSQMFKGVFHFESP